MLKRSWLLIITLLLCLVSAGCSVNPVTGESQFNVFGSDIKNDVSLGQQWAPKIEEEFEGVIEDAQIADYINNIGRNIARHSHAPYLQWHFKALENDMVNAFALPGGYIYITTGMLKKLSTEAQLAGVFAHEASHVTLRHSTVRMSEQIGLSILIAAAIPKNTSRSVLQATSVARQIIALKYSRDDEQQSDKVGMWYLVKAGYDPYGMVETMQILEAESDERPAEFLSSHPAPKNRVQYLRSKIENNYSDLKDMKVGREEYQKMVLDRLTQIEKPAE